jgi:uncharacterized protein (DUF488 family)
MFYRRKIFLALLQSFSGSLNSTDFEKLLFLYCRYSNKNHYDFFPYKYGGFSYLSYQDRRILINQGFLKDVEHLSLAKKENYLHKLNRDDRESVQKFADLYKNLSGKKLIKKTYQDFPYYAVRSKIAQEILNEEELNKVKEVKNISEDKVLFTLGYEGLTIDAYINKLIYHNIALVIDVRKNPLSMKYGFSKSKMKNYLNNAGIEYVHIPQLGIVSQLRKNLKTETDYKELFEIYKKEILPENSEYIENVIKLLNQYKRAALTCFESVHTSCHRHKITEWLENDNSFREEIVHI